MTSLRECARLVSIAVMGMVVAATNVHAGGPQPEPPKIEQSIKIKASGRMAFCRMNVRARGFLGAIDPQQEEDLLGKCSTKLGSAFLKAEARCQASGALDCVTNDAPIIGSRLQILSDRLEAFLAQEAVPAQRYVDNGDGTITDNQTGLMWEKKSTSVGSGSNLVDPHDVDNLYTWSAIGGTMPNGTAFADFLDKLNNCASSDGDALTGGFAGHCDWRLPSIVELTTILLAPFPCGTNPCIDPVFGPTVPGGHWSATTEATSPDYAWLVYFGVGGMDQDGKDSAGYVRAVRGGM